MDHHTALKLVPLGLACLKTSGCTDFDPLNTKESDVIAQNVFSQKQSSYSFETCTTVISMPENCRVQWVWPSKYKGKWHYSPKCVFSKMDHHTALKLVPLGSACLKTSGCTALWPSKYKGKWCYRPKCVFSEMDHHTALIHTPLQSACLKTSGCTDFDPLNIKESDVIAQNVFSKKWIIIQLWNLYHWDWHAWTLQVCWVGPTKYKGKWCYRPKCVFSKTDHHTALKLVPLQSACLKTSGCNEFDPPNTKESDIIAQNAFSQKWIIQIWNLYHWDWHAWKPQGALTLTL